MSEFAISLPPDVAATEFESACYKNLPIGHWTIS
jgi:hypothetical protein